MGDFLHFAETNFFDWLKTSFSWEVLSLATFGKSRLIEISTISLFFFFKFKMYAIWQVQKPMCQWIDLKTLCERNSMLVGKGSWHRIRPDKGHLSRPYRSVMLEKTARCLIDFYNCINQIPLITKNGEKKLVIVDALLNGVPFDWSFLVNLFV